jgi:hypothetical protein
MLVLLHNLGRFAFYTHVASLKNTPFIVAYRHPPALIHLPFHSQHIVRHDRHSDRHVAIHSLHVILEDLHSLHVILHDHWQML